MLQFVRTADFGRAYVWLVGWLYVLTCMSVTTGLGLTVNVRLQNVFRRVQVRVDRYVFVRTRSIYRSAEVVIIIRTVVYIVRTCPLSTTTVHTVYIISPIFVN